MSPRKPNMLEAFRASDEQPLPPPPAAPTPKAPKVRAPKAPRPERASAASGASAWPERTPVFAVVTLAALGLVGGAYWLGRATAPRAAGAELLAAAPEAESWSYPSADEPTRPQAPRAGAPDAEASALVAPAPAADEFDEQGRTADDRSFYDKTNRYTVRAIYYGNTPRGWKRALGAYRYLRAQGLPAIAPIDQGEILVLCVGAEPKMQGRLTELGERLRALPGPPPQHEAGAFAGAYFVNIDDLVERP